MKLFRILNWSFAALLAVLLLYFVAGRKVLHAVFPRNAVLKVGVLHSTTGTMAISEKPVADATLLAIEEINKKGGIIGMKIVPVVADGKSDPEVFAKEAERLITKEKVKVIFGCWTSNSRKAVKAVVEKYHSLLFYPVQYEGLEESPNIVYLGAAPNQQVIPAVRWCADNLGKRFFLVGSDYVFPRVANAVAKDVIGFSGGSVVGEEYVPLGGTHFSRVVEKIAASNPDVILNTVSGDSNIAFFKALQEKEILSAEIPVMLLSVGESELSAFREVFKNEDPANARHFWEKHLVGTYACWNYFESIGNKQNLNFISRIRKKLGQGTRVTDPMEAAYYGVWLWTQAVNECQSADTPSDILNSLRHMSIPTPGGIITIAGNNHSRKTVRIGKANAKGQYDVVWASDNPVDPDPYPIFREKDYWDSLLNDLRLKWHNRWMSFPRPAPSGEKR